MKIQKCQQQPRQLQYSIETKDQVLRLKFSSDEGVIFKSLINFPNCIDSDILSKYEKTQIQKRIDFTFRHIEGQSFCTNDHSLLEDEIKSKLRVEHICLRQASSKGYDQPSRQPISPPSDEKHEFQLLNLFLHSDGKILQEQFLRLHPQVCRFYIVRDNSRHLQRGDVLFFIRSVTPATQQSLLNSFSRSELHENEQVVVHNSDKSIKRIIRHFESFTKETVLFALDEYFGEKIIGQLQRMEISFSSFERILNKLILFIKEELINHISHSCRLSVKEIDRYLMESKTLKKKRFPHFEGKCAIMLTFVGMTINLPKLFLKIQSFLSSHPITFVQIDKIQTTHLCPKKSRGQQLSAKEEERMSEENAHIFFGDEHLVAVLDLKSKYGREQNLKRALKQGTFLVSTQQGFDIKQIETLIKQFSILEDFIKGENSFEFLSYKFIKNDEQSFFIKSEHSVFERFLKRAKQYLKANQKKVYDWSECFESPFDVYLFLNYGKPQIERQFATAYFSLNENSGKLESQNREKDMQAIKQEVKMTKQKIYKNVVRLATIVKPTILKSCQKEKYFTSAVQRETVIGNLEGYRYRFLKGDVEINIKSVFSLNRYEESLITLIDREFQKAHCFMKYINENDFNLDSYKNYEKLSQKRPVDRIVGYVLKKSLDLNQMTVWYLDRNGRGQVNYSKLKRDISDFVSKYTKEPSLKFVIPACFDDGILEDFFITFFQYLDMHGKDKLAKVDILFEEKGDPQRVFYAFRKIFSRKNGVFFNLVTKQIISETELEAIHFAQKVALKFPFQNATKMVTYINAFLFDFELQKAKKHKNRVPLFLKEKKSANLVEYIICIKTDEFFCCDRFGNAEMIKTDKVSPVLKEFRKKLAHFFTNLEYIAAYLNPQGQIDCSSLYIWSSESESRVKKLNISAESGKFEINSGLTVSIRLTEPSYVSNYIIQTHKDSLRHLKAEMYNQKQH